MLSEEQIKQVEYAFKHGDAFVFVIEGHGVFVADRVLKHKKEATVEMREVYEINESCFSDDEYYGDTCGPEKMFILSDPYADNPNLVASRYYQDEIREEVVTHA